METPVLNKFLAFGINDSPKSVSLLFYKPCRCSEETVVHGCYEIAVEWPNESIGFCSKETPWKLFDTFEDAKAESKKLNSEVLAWEKRNAEKYGFEFDQ